MDLSNSGGGSDSRRRRRPPIRGCSCARLEPRGTRSGAPRTVAARWPRQTAPRRTPCCSTLPLGLDGLAVCRRVRAKGLVLPILLLTARDAVEDRVAGLDAGADDYLVKPFARRECRLRPRAVRFVRARARRDSRSWRRHLRRAARGSLARAGRDLGSSAHGRPTCSSRRSVGAPTSSAAEMALDRARPGRIGKPQRRRSLCLVSPLDARRPAAGSRMCGASGSK